MTPAEIAKRLTPAQRRALLWLPEDGHLARMVTDHGIRRSLYALEDRRLASRIQYGSWWFATERGQQVRALVAQEDARDAG
jgi:hypothetical protein